MSAPRPESQRAAANRELVDDIRRVHHDAAVEPPTAILGILVARASAPFLGVVGERNGCSRKAILTH
jgi:hypothetical protein